MATGTPTNSGIKTIVGTQPISANDINSVLGSIDGIVGAPRSTLTTTAKTLVGAINEINGDTRVLRLRPQPIGIDANTLGTGIYMIAQANDWATLNYPTSYGVLVSFITSTYVLQIFGQVTGTLSFYMRSGTGSSTWFPWKQLAVV